MFLATRQNFKKKNSKKTPFRYQIFGQIKNQHLVELEIVFLFKLIEMFDHLLLRKYHIFNVMDKGFT